MLRSFILATFIMVGLASPTLAQLTWEQQQALTSWYNRNGQFVGIGKTVFDEFVSSSHPYSRSLSRYSDSLVAISALLDIANARTPQAFQSLFLEYSKKKIGDHLPGPMRALGWFSAAKTSMELFKDFVFDPVLLGEALDHYATRRDWGDDPGGAITTIRAIGTIDQLLLPKFREVHGDSAFEYIGASNLNLHPSWRGTFEQFKLEAFEQNYQFRKLQERKAEMLKVAAENQAETDERIRDLLLAFAEEKEKERSANRAKDVDKKPPVKDNPVETPTTPEPPRGMRVAVQGPDQAASLEMFSLRAEVREGLPPYTYSWLTPTGKRSPKQQISGRLEGKPGERQLFELRVRDSSVPPQETVLQHWVNIVENGIKIDSLQAAPSPIDPGKELQVSLRFSGRETLSNNAPARVSLWVESSPGLGRGETKKTLVRMSRGTTSTTFKISEKAKKGSVKVMGEVVYGDQIVRASTTADVTGKRPSGLEDVTVDSRNITLRIWDHGSEDGDVVRVFFNGGILMGPVTITAAGTTIPLTLKSGENRLTVFAVNEGSQTPNTASIYLTNVIQGPAKQAYQLNTNQSGEFFIVAP